MTPVDRKLQGSSARESLREGKCYAVMIGSGETFLGAAAVQLSATALQIGILATFPPLIGALAQIWSLRFIDSGISRRKIAVCGAYFGAAMLLAIAALCGLGSRLEAGAFLLIVFSALYFFGTGLSTPAWSSLIGDLVASPARIHFFALRNRSVGIWTFFTSLTAGNFLALMEKMGSSSAGFLTAFIASSCARFFSARSLSRHEDPDYTPEPEAYFSFFSFLRRAPHSNFAKFVLFFSFIHFGVSIAGPYFTPYMLRDLGISYTAYTILSASAIGSQFLAMRKWGHLSERFGNRKILTICGICVGIVPMLWLVSTSFAFLFLIQIFAGFAWAGFNLAAQSFLYEAVTRPKLARCAAYQAVLSGVFVCCGSLLGAFLQRQLESSPATLASLPLVSNSSEVLFMLSGSIRLLAVLLILPTIREVRDLGPEANTKLIFRIAHIRPIAGGVFSVVSNTIRRNPTKKK